MKSAKFSTQPLQERAARIKSRFLCDPPAVSDPVSTRVWVPLPLPLPEAEALLRLLLLLLLLRIPSVAGMSILHALPQLDRCPVSLPSLVACVCRSLWISSLKGQQQPSLLLCSASTSRCSCSCNPERSSCEGVLSLSAFALPSCLPPFSCPSAFVCVCPLQLGASQGGQGRGRGQGQGREGGGGQQSSSSSSKEGRGAPVPSSRRQHALYNTSHEGDHPLAIEEQINADRYSVHPSSCPPRFSG